MNELTHLIKLSAQQQFGDNHHLLTGTLVAYNPQIGAGRVSIDAYRNEDGSTTITQWLPILTIGAGPATGIQVIPVIGQPVLVGVLEGEEGYFFTMGFFWSPIMQTPISALLPSAFSASLDTNTTIDPPVFTADPGDVVIRHPSGAVFYMNSDEIAMRNGPGSSIRLAANGDIIFQAAGKVLIQSTDNTQIFSQGQFNTSSANDTQMQSGGNFDVTAQNKMNVQIQKDILITSAEEAITIEAAQKGVEISAPMGDIALNANNNVSITSISDTVQVSAPTTTFIGAQLETHNTIQNFGYQNETTNILMFAPTWEAVGATNAILTGSIVNIGTNNIGDTRAQSINILANAGGAGLNNINLTTTGNNSSINVNSSDTLWLDGNTETLIYGANIIIGEDLLGASHGTTSTLPHVTIGGVQVDIAAGINQKGNLNLWGGQFGDVNIVNETGGIYANANGNVSVTSNGDLWLLGQINAYLLGTTVDIGIASATQVPGASSDVSVITAPQMNGFNLYSSDIFLGGSGLQAQAGTIELRALSTKIDLNSSNLLQLLTAQAMTIFNEHVHEGESYNTGPPMPTMDSTCLTQALTAQGNG